MATERPKNFIGRKQSPYMIGITLAIIMFMLIAPEMHEGKAMSPTIEDGSFLVVSKHTYSQNRGEPEREQVVIMEKTTKNSERVSDDNIISRVIGLPGDQIDIKKGKVFVNGEEYITEKGIKGSDSELSVKLTKDQVFLLGDNREEHIDSTNEELGPVDMKDIKGNVLFCMWPFSEFGRIH